MPRVQVRDIQMSYYDNGVGDLPLVLVHGFPLDKRMWELQFERLLYRHRVVTPDLRGHGESEVTAGPYTMESLADDLGAFLDAMGIQQVALGGFSMGGYVALAFYRKHPERVRGLLLLDTKAGPDSEDARRGREEMARLAEQEGSAPIAERLLPRLLTAETIAGRPDLVDRLQRMMVQCPVEAIAGDLRGMALRGDSTDLLPQVSVPALVMVGAGDVITPPAESELMASSIPNARLVVLPGAGHASNVERPAEFNAAVSEFLDSL